MADARLIIHHHRDDARWARRLRRVASANEGLQVALGMSPDPDAGGPAPKHIHICSPAYAATPRALDWGEHFVLIVAGEPGASVYEGAMDEECLPAPLRSAQRIDARADRRADGVTDEAVACQAVAAAVGVELGDIRKPIARRRLVRGLNITAACTFGVALFVGGMALLDQRKINELAVETSAGISAAANALDEGDDGAAYGAIAEALQTGRALTDQGRAVVRRAIQETRLLADLPAPSKDITGLSFLPGGAIAATGENGGAWLVDPGTGVAAQISAPSPGVVARLSPAGDRLWTARPGTPAFDETGAPYAPLTFFDIDLAQAEVVSETVIRAPVGRLSEGAISPDGALFAADVGPGAGAETLVAVFRRGSQALAGVLRLPSDSAAVRFVGPDRLLATINPPSGYGESPGLYLWRVGAAAPIMLRQEGLAPVCLSDVSKANAAAVRDAQMTGALAMPKILAAPSGREIALLLPRLDRGACLLRWAAPSGAVLEALDVPGRAIDADLLAEGGPYLIRRKGRAATLLRQGAPAISLTPCRTGVVLPLSPPGGRADAFLCSDGDDGVQISPKGAIWRRRMHDGGVTVAAQGPGARIATTGRDGRIRLWESAPRALQGPADLRDALSFETVSANDETGPHVVATYPSGLLWVFAAAGAEAGAVVPTGLTSPQVRSFAPDKVVVLGMRGEEKYWRSVNLATGELGALHPQDLAATFIMRGPMIKSGSWTRRMFETDGGAARVMFQALDGERALLALDRVSGATAKVEREGEGTIWVGLAGRGVTHDVKFAGRGGAIRLSSTGDVALLRIEATSAPHDDEFHVLDVASGRSIRVFGAPPVSGWFDFSGSGDTFAIKSLDPTTSIPLFDAQYGRQIGSAPGGRAQPVWAPSGDVLATAGAGRVTVTAVVNGQAQQQCSRDETPSRYLAFTEGGDDVIAAARAGGVTVLRRATCTVRLRVPDARVRAAPFAPTSNVIWVPTETGVSILRLDVDTPDYGLVEMIKRRARALAATR